jgi:8-oxo-dGTP diphosphatase
MLLVAKALIFDSDGGILTLFRSGTHPKYAHDADFPGGAVEGDETPAAGAARELMEEAGIQVDATDLTQMYERDVPEKQHRHFVFVGRVPAAPDVTLSWEHESFAWMSPEELFQEEKLLRSTDAYCKTVRIAYKETKLNNS